jgi:hypothetical protein
MSETTITDLEIREKLARIDQLNADAARRRQEFELGYRMFWVSAVTAAAALLGGGAALGAFIAKLFH